MKKLISIFLILLFIMPTYAEARIKFKSKIKTTIPHPSKFSGPGRSLNNIQDCLEKNIRNNKKCVKEIKNRNLFSRTPRVLRKSLEETNINNQQPSLEAG